MRKVPYNTPMICRPIHVHLAFGLDEDITPYYSEKGCTYRLVRARVARQSGNVYAQYDLTL